MPYYITDQADECAGWAVTKENGDIVGCHETKADAIDQMVALSIAEDIEPGGERSTRQVELDVPQYVRDAAARGLELRNEGYGGDGLVERTIREARQMAAGEISEDKVIRANAWGARHAVDLDAPKNSDSDNDQWPGAGAVAHYLWGINPLNPEPARDWFARKAEQIQAERSLETGETPMTEDTEDIRFDAPKDNLVRHVEFRADPSGDGLTLE
jgi:hypothetical protein